MAPARQKIMRSMRCRCSLLPIQDLSLISHVSLDKSYR